MRIPIAGDADVGVACQRCRDLAVPVGFSAVDLTMIATVVSTLARRILTHALQGEIELHTENGVGLGCIFVTARFDCPGLQAHLRLQGLARLMDEVQVEATQISLTVRARKAVSPTSPTATKPARGSVAS